MADQKIRLIAFVGGPLDGTSVPNVPGYFREGDFEAVDTLSLMTTNAEWSAESVYQMRGGKLVYDAAATRRRAAVVARERN